MSFRGAGIQILLSLVKTRLAKLYAKLIIHLIGG